MSGWDFQIHDKNDQEQICKIYFPQYYELFMNIPFRVAKTDIVRVMCLYLLRRGYTSIQIIK